MAVDYLARKAAKKQRKADSVKPRRERKKKGVPRRLCRGACYSQEPGLGNDDQEEQAAQKRAPRGSSNSELARAAAAAAAVLSAAKRKQTSAAEPATQPVPAPPANAPKRRKLSTAINLLDATARTEAPRRQKGLLLEAISDELKQFPAVITRFMAGEGFSDLMPVQARCWPVLLAGRDVEAIAEPGSGKTLAYVLPAAKLLADKGHGAETQPDGPLALVLLPTRELAQQVAGVCRDLRKYCGLRTCCITGGTDKQQQMEALSKRPHIVVATPGRLLDQVQEGALNLAHVAYLVLDESDKMSGLGFQPQIEQLKLLLESKRRTGGLQVGLFTATMPDSLQALAADWLQQPELVRGATSAASISKSITQVVQVCSEHKKAQKLLKHLKKIAESQGRVRHRVLVFTNRIKTCKFVHRLVRGAGHRAALLHGERSQEEREAAIRDFRGGKAQILVATDVAARGLHVNNLRYIIIWDISSDLSTYIHRVGRTGRLATDGHAFSFFTREMARLAGPMVELLQQNDQPVDPNLIKLAESYQIAKEKMELSEASGEDDIGSGDDEQLKSPHRTRVTSDAKQQQNDEFRALKQRYTHKPIGGLPQTKTAVLPGKLKELKRQRRLAAGFSSSDDESGALASPLPAIKPSKRHKALPGRLRKKLAKQPAA